MSALQNQNDAVQTLLRRSLDIAQGLQELPGAITTLSNRAQAPKRRMLVDQKGLEKPPSALRQRKKTSTCGPRQLSTACSVRAKLLVLMRVIERLEDLMGRYCGRRDTHTLAYDIRMSPLAALLLDDLENHVQSNRARLTSCVVLREEIKTKRECRIHAHVRNTKPKGPSYPGGNDPMNIDAIGQGKGKHDKGKGKGKGKQGQQGPQDKTRTKTRTRIQLNVGIVESAVTTRRTVGARRHRPTKRGFKGRLKSKNTTDAHNLDSTTPANNVPEVEIGGIEMNQVNVYAVEVRESE